MSDSHNQQEQILENQLKYNMPSELFEDFYDDVNLRIKNYHCIF